MKSSSGARRVAGLGAATFLLSACGIGNVFGDRESAIYVTNDTSDRFYAGATDHEEGPGFGADVAPGQTREVIWSTCKTAWLFLSTSDERSAEELAHHEVTLCPGDGVTVDAGHELTVECGERSREVRESEC